MAKLERIDETDDAKEVLLERDDTTVALDIMNELNAAPEDTNWKFTVCRINTDKNGVAINGALEPQIMEGDASIMDDLAGRLREEFGTGRYRVRILANKRLWKRFDIAVERAMKATPIVTPERQSEMATVLAAMGKQNEQIIALLSRQNVPAVAAPAFDPLTMFDKILGIVKNLQPAPAPPPVDLAEKSVALILQGVELGKSVAGEGHEKGMMDIISDLIQSPLIAKLAEATPIHPAMNLPPPLPARAVPPKNSEGKPPPVNPAPNTAEANPAVEQMKMLRARILYLLDKANHGSSYETYAEWIFDNWEPSLIRDFLSQPDPIQSLRNLAPEIIPQLQWFTKLIDDLRELVNDADAASGNGDAPGSGPSPIGPLSDPGRESGSVHDAEDDD